MNDERNLAFLLLRRQRWGEHRVLVIDRDTGQILWCCTNLRVPLEAIYWDDEHIMVSDCKHGIFKVRLSDGATVWHYDTG